MAPSTKNNPAEDKVQGKLIEMKGAIKEKIGNLINDRDLGAEGKTEKKEGKVQQKLASAKENVTKLKGQLAETRKSKS